MQANRRTVQGAVFYAGDDMILGTMLRIELQGKLVQLHILDSVVDYVRKSDGTNMKLLIWSTMCTDCGSDMEHKSRNVIKDMPRRCKRCRTEKPYDPAGWMKRPRNKYIRIDPVSYDEVDPASLF